jgi:peptidoglycan hydrolase-like protein with peptidoglycan-binding domain
VQTRALLVLPLLLAALALVDGAAAVGDARIAALQVALRHSGVYRGPVDGAQSRATTRAVRALQRRAGLTVDGVAGPVTLRALGPFARHAPGTRELRLGRSGMDVAWLQFALALHGFRIGTIDGGFGLHTDWALRRFQYWVGLHPDGRAGAATFAALRRPAPRSPIALRRPVRARLARAFGPHGIGFHYGVAFAVAPGTAVAAAATGRVAFARDGAVTLASAHHVRTLYRGLATTRVRVGQLVAAGSTLGLTGRRDFHFEVRVRGAAVDPLRSFR